MCSTDRLVGADELAPLVAVDLDGLDGAALLDRTAALVALRNRVDAELARTVRAAELAQAPGRDGLRSMASWLRGHARLSPSAAARLVANGRALEELPAVAAGCAAGVVSAEQVAVVGAVAAPERLAAAAQRGVDLAVVDATVAGIAVTGSWSDLAQVVHRYLAWLDQDGPEPDPTEGRRLTISRHADGSITGRFELDAVGGEKVQAALESLVQADRPAGDERSRSQQLADAFVQLCDNQLAAGNLPVLRGTKPQVVVTLAAEDLFGADVVPASARTGFGAVVSAARARWMACDAEVTRIVLGPDGQPLELGRSVRLVPAPLRKAVVQRDQHCVFAGCDAPHYWCEVHHLIAWAQSGETGLDNSGLLCERHHTQVHHGFRVERDHRQRWHTYRPDGTEIRTPEPLLSPAA